MTRSYGPGRGSAAALLALATALAALAVPAGSAAAAPAAPVVTTPANGSTIATTQPEVSGTAAANSTVTVFVDGTPSGTSTTATAGGTWSVTQPTALSEGSHTVRATASDGSGTSPSSNTNTFTVDTVPPAAPVLAAPADNAIVGTRRPTVTGVAEARSAVTLRIDDATLGTAIADASGNWSFTLPTLTEGEHTVSATARDGAGNSSPASAARRFTVDTSTPAAPVVNLPSSTGVVNTSTPTLTGTAEAGSTVRVFADSGLVGTTTATGAGQWSLTPSEPLPLGTSDLTATATDAAGNVSPSSSRITVTVDTTAPAAPVITTPVDGSAQTATPVYRGTAEAFSRVTVTVDSVLLETVTVGPSGQWETTRPRVLLRGEHVVSASATDMAGNTGPASTATFTVDDVAAVATITTVGAGPFGRAIPFRVTFDEPVDYLDSYRVYVERNGGFVTDSQVRILERGAGFDVTVVLPEQVGGTGVVRIVLGGGAASDLAGNSSAATTGPDAAYDLVAPAAPVVTSPANGASINTPSPVYSGTAEPGSTVDVFIFGTQVVTTTTDALGHWSTADSNTYLGFEETFVVTARAVDAAGNVSEPSSGVTVTLDTLAPTLTLTAPAGVRQGSFSVEAAFSEAVTGFELADVQVGNGSASDLVALSPSRYRVLVTPTRSGEVAVEVAAGAATDAVGNPSATDRLTRTYQQPATPAVQLTQPTLDGEAVVGGVLRAASTPTPSNAQLTYRWSRVTDAGTTEIPGATGAAYTVTPADAGARLVVTVIGSAPGHEPAVAASAPTAPVVRAVADALTVSVDGTARVGERLTAQAPPRHADATRTYQWQTSRPDGSFGDLRGATDATLDVAPSLAGSALRVVVADTRPGFDDAVGVATTAPVERATIALTRPRVVGGRPLRVGDAVTAAVRATGGDGGAVAGLRLTYTWRVDGKELRRSGASIVLPRRAAGSVVRVVVSASAPGHDTVSRWSSTVRVRAARTGR